MAPRDNRHIYGTPFLNDSEGVTSYRDMIVANERGRVKRNLAREQGDYNADIFDAEITLADMNPCDYYHPRDKVLVARDIMSGFKNGNYDKHTLTEALMEARDTVAAAAKEMADNVIRLDEIIRRFENGEPE